MAAIADGDDRSATRRVTLMRSLVRPATAAALIGLVAAAVFTWPLALHLDDAIPYALNPAEGYERYPLMPGDHLQSYYWFWLITDNLRGNSPFRVNPYEFNGAAGPMVGGFANFPFSLLYAALSPLGPVAAYNALVVLSFLLAAVSVFLFVRWATGGRYLPILAGAVFAAIPARVSALAGGQLLGFVAFLMPLTLALAERSIATGALRWSLGAGACLAASSLMEPHVAYYTVLTLMLYLPARYLCCRFTGAPEGPERASSPLVGLAMVLVSGAALALAAVDRVLRSLPPEAGRGPLSAEAFLAWPLLALTTWLFASAVLARTTALPFGEARDRTARLFLPFLLAAAVPAAKGAGLPHAGKILLGAAAILGGAGFARILLRSRPGLRGVSWRSVAVTGAGVGAGTAAAAAYLLQHKAGAIATSVAASGRSLREVLLFSGSPRGLFVMDGGPRERFILLGTGLAALALVGLLGLLRKTPPERSGLRAVAGLLGFGSAVLSVGPTMQTFPLYQALFEHFPFFNYPRVPGRFTLVAALFLGLLASEGLADLVARIPRRRALARAAVAAAAAAAVLVPFHSGTPMGLSFFPAPGPLPGAVAARLPADGGRLLLELPIWPGDSHQSSVYEYGVTLTRRPIVNGYSPLVTRAYVDGVYEPLSPLNLGQLTDREAQALRALRVGLVTFHDDDMVYPVKIAPFPPRFVERRLAASGWLDPVLREGKVSLFAVRSTRAAGGDPSLVTSPATAVWYASSLNSPLGVRGSDPAASGYHLAATRWGGGNIIRSPGSGAGYLALGPPRGLPAGRYHAAFRLRTTAPGGARGRLEIADGSTGTVLAARPYSAADFAVSGRWEDLIVPFDLAGVTETECRVWAEEGAAIELNLVAVRFAAAGTGPGTFQAEDLFRQTGAVVADAAAEGGEAVAARGGSDPPLYLMHGPYRTVEPGRYLAGFALRGNDAVPGATVASLEVATDMGRRILATRKVAAAELAGAGYAEVEVPFEAPFRCEIDLRIRFAGEGELRVDRAGIRAPAPAAAGSSQSP